MSEHIEEQRVPRFALVSIAVLIALALVSSATARLTGMGATKLVLAAPVSSASLKFADLEDGSVGVTDAASGRQIARYTPGTSGFVRVVLRSFAFNRSRAGIGADAPFILSERADGQLVIEDPATRHVVTLDAFGHGNVTAFQDLLKKGKEMP